MQTLTITRGALRPLTTVCLTIPEILLKTSSLNQNSRVKVHVSTKSHLKCNCWQPSSRSNCIGLIQITTLSAQPINLINLSVNLQDNIGNWNHHPPHSSIQKPNQNVSIDIQPTPKQMGNLLTQNTAWVFVISYCVLVNYFSKLHIK